MNNATFWIVAGPNGAGKTTLVQSGPIAELVRDVEFLNPDDVSLLMLCNQGFAGWSDVPEKILRDTFIRAADAVFQQIKSALEQGRSIGVETVLSTDKYRPLIENVLEGHGSVGLIYVTLSSSAIAVSRVQNRISCGGHAVPVDKITERWQRSLDGLEWYLRNVSAFWIFDNSGSTSGVAPKYLATGQKGALLAFDETATFPELRRVLSKLPRQ